MLPFVVVASIYGMNVVLPGGLGSGSLQPFFWLILAMVMISGIMLYFFHRKGWI